MSSPAPSTSKSEDITEAIQITIPDQKIMIPLFLKKLWKIVNDPSSKEIIDWNDSGDSFIIHDQVAFVTQLLPQYFKHNNLSSFVRQLNFYDFHKVANIEPHEMEFAHPYFLKFMPESLAYITRKTSNVKSRLNQTVQEEHVEELLSGMKELKSKHIMINNELKMLKQENGALWNEINSLRVKYSKQTKIINKLIHFLISYMHSHQNNFGKTNINVNRKLDPKLLRNTPQLLQIGYNKTPHILNSKVLGSEKRTPINVNASNQKYFVKPDLFESIRNSGKSKPKVNSYQLKDIVSEFDPTMYNFTSPQQYETVLISDQSQYPIEELVESSEGELDLEENSTYSVKFPQKDHTKQNPTNSYIKTESSNSIKINKGKGTENLIGALLKKQPNLPKMKKLLHDKRKSSEPVDSIPEVKLQKMSPKQTKNFGRHKIPKKQDKVTKSKPVTPILNRKSSSSTLSRPEPSSIKSDIILENLFAEIENSNTENISTLVQDKVHSANQIVPKSDQNASENFPEIFLAEAVDTNEMPMQLTSEDTETPDDLLSSQNAVEKGSPFWHTTPADVSLVIDPAINFTDKSLLDGELEDYPNVLSSLPNDIPEATPPSLELSKYNIIENPKENLGLYLDNTQLQLDNIQDLLNDLNSDGLFDLLGCFNVDNESADGKSTLGADE